MAAEMGYRRVVLYTTAAVTVAITGLVLPTSAATATPAKTWVGTKGVDVFDLVTSQKNKVDRVYGKAGRDYIFMKADGKRDVIRCGKGKDLVHYLGKRERRDVYIGCERVEPYSP